MQELATMNIQMRIITEENIDQLTSMNFSDNIIKLTGNEKVTAAEIKKRAQNKQFKNIGQTDIMNNTPQPDYTAVPPPEGLYQDNPFMDTPPVQGYAPVSPPPLFKDESPLYVPTSPPYQPTSPPYDPNSPPYQPTTPAYVPNKPDSLPEYAKGKSEPLHWGWKFDRSGWEEGDIYKSLIVPEDGRAASWWVDDHDYQAPSEYPPEWKPDDLIRSDGTRIHDVEVIQGLLADQQPGNWSRVVSKLKNEQASPAYQPTSPPYKPTSPAYDPNKPPSSPYNPVSPDYPPNTPPEQGDQLSGGNKLHPAPVPTQNIIINVGKEMVGGDDPDDKNDTPTKDDDKGVQQDGGKVLSVKTQKAGATKIEGLLGLSETTGGGSDDGGDSNSSQGGGKKKVVIKHD